jgi:nucleoid DNA-binding protein
MNLEEIVKNARAENESAFGKVNDKRAVKILRAAFKQVNSQLESAKDGNLTIRGLGRFAIKNVEREKDGVKVTKQRVIFHRRGAGKGRQAESDQS